MTETPENLLDARNARLEERFVASRLYDPTLEKKIKPSTHVVLIPDHDAELEAHNRAYAKALMAAGTPIQFIMEADLMTKEAIGQRQQARRQVYLDALSGLKERLEGNSGS